MTIKEFFSFRKNRFFWINIILMIVVLALLVVGTFYGLDVYTQHGKSVVVPEVKGLGLQEARLQLESKGLKVAVLDSNYVKELTPGSVLEQNPAGKLPVKSGRVVYLTINNWSVPLLAVPDVADNSSLRQAQAKLLAVGFKLTTEEYIAGERDWVYGVKYKGEELEIGEKAPIGATLTLMVGRGDTRKGLEDQENTVVNEEPEETTVVDELWF